MEENRITAEYTLTTDMIADGLTKALTNTTFQKFTEQVRLVDVKEHLERRRLRKLKEEELLVEISDLE